MRAFVLGGGGNLGAMQVGALKALFEQGIRPDFLLGCSVGALNAAMLACDYSEASLEKLCLLWKIVKVQDVFPGSKLSYAWRFLTRQDGLCNNQPLYNFLVTHGINAHKTFGHLNGIPLYVTATNLKTSQLDVFGHHKDERLIDALMATSAQPPLLPPWEINGTQYVDGGTVTPLPLRSAIDLGATEIYSLRIEHKTDGRQRTAPTKPVRGMAGVVKRSVSMMIQQQAEYDLLLVKNHPDITLHEIELGSQTVSRTDFSQGEALCGQGYEIMRAYLEHRTVRLPCPSMVCQPIPVETGDAFALRMPLSTVDLYTAAD